MTDNKATMIRWLLIILLLVAVIAGANFWLSSDSVNESNLPLPEKNNSLPPKTETLTVEKLNHQVQVKQLRQALIHEEPLSATEAISGDDIDQQIESLEQELQQLSTEK
ncbi:hypothetical protein [Vibrio mangrovi]|uniref:Uncharacterized protein n=1 Tax=Vibrio mangrovi TaxID=474394 RepID=A0A1Y6IWI8_9VIBR|nr:hypothetical protein [Vibrio mangrovi]MDW6002465.1 hypothetical protein [Vibrio mangrovi]SMS02006.1 hypothetical protein VIM7927_03317 [Vibrio mangrovi]